MDQSRQCWTRPTLCSCSTPFPMQRQPQARLTCTPCLQRRRTLRLPPGSCASPCCSSRRRYGRQRKQMGAMQAAECPSREEQLAAERRTGSTCTDASASRSRYLPVGDKNALTTKVPCTSASAASAAAALNVAGSTTLCCDAMLLLGSAAVTNGN